MDKQKELIPKTGVVAPVDSDDELYDNPNDIRPIHLIPSLGRSLKTSSIQGSQSHLAKLGDDDNQSSRSFNQYSITNSNEDKELQSRDVIKIHTLNLNDRKQRLLLLSMLLFIWCIPTLILSLDIYANNDNQQAFIRKYSIINNKLHLSSMTIILFACILLLLFEIIEFRNFWLGSMIGSLYIAGGCAHFAATIVYAHGHCYNSVTIDDKNGYCYIGYIGASNLGCVFPMLLGIDVIWSILNNKYARTMTLC
eukprot:UN05301